MFQSFNMIVLAALRDGVVLFDNGTWKGYQARYRQLIEGGHLIRGDRSWRWTKEAEQLVLEGGGEPTSQGGVARGGG